MNKKLGRDPLAWINQPTEPTPDEPKEEQPKAEVTVRKSPAGRPRTIKREVEKSSQEGLPVNWTRYTVIVREDLLDRLKDYAWSEERSMKDVVNEMIEVYLTNKETDRKGDDR